MEDEKNTVRDVGHSHGGYREADAKKVDGNEKGRACVSWVKAKAIGGKIRGE